MHVILIFKTNLNSLRSREQWTDTALIGNDDNSSFTTSE